MTDQEKIAYIRTILTDDDGELSTELLTAYVELAGKEILAWMYHLVGGVPSDVTAVPSRYEAVQIYSVIAGFTQAGAEGQRNHTENGVTRQFRYSDMLDYIHNNVLAIVRVGAVSTS